MNQFKILLIGLVIFFAGYQSKNPNEKPALSSRPEDVKFITSDINLFWRMYDKEVPLFTNPEIRNEYLHAGTSALSLFYNEKVHSPTMLYNLLNSWIDRQYFNEVRANTLKLTDQKPSILNALKSFQQLYPQAVFPDIHFVIGALNTGGAVLPNGQLIIAAEMFSKQKDADISYLSPWLQTVLHKPDYLPVIIIHELVHVQQRQFAIKHNLTVGGQTLLDRALLEGSADFITNLVLGRSLNDHLQSYANPIEKQLWQKFQPEMNSHHLSKWLYNGHLATKQPADLGYYIGFKITEAFYNKAKNKQQAIQDIIKIKSGKNFLQKSGYAKSFE